MKNPALLSLKWLYPGMRVKRWLSLALVGLLVILMGAALFNHARPVDFFTVANNFWNWLEMRTSLRLMEGGAPAWIGATLIASGLALILFALARLIQSLTASLNPRIKGTSLADVVYRNSYLSQGARVVVIGGGTGLSTMLRGLKQYTSNITAIVTVTDDGGSSGKLLRQLNILPPGDIRNCLVALADAEATMTDLFQYRFKGLDVGEGLRDHNFGNLLIAAMTGISGGDFEAAVRLTSQVLNIRGRVLPSTLCQVKLRGEMDDGTIIDGETNIATSPLRIKKIHLCPDNAEPLQDVLDAILTADIIVIGPGSVYTSVIPNLLVRGIPEALHHSHARKVYVCNVMTQPGESDGFAASDHIKAIDSHMPRPVLDYVIVNTAIPTLELLNKYRRSGAVLVEADIDRIRSMGIKPIPGNYISQTDVVRHDGVLLAEAIMRLLT
jgi:uncharacterized cofD-like protein